MSRRLPRFHAPALPASGRLRLPEEEGRHLARVLRARPGDAVRLFDGAGREVDATVASVGREGVDVDIGADVEAPRPRRDVHLLTSIPRGERMEWLVEKCVEAGVGAIVPLVPARTVRREAGPNVVRRWRRAAVEAAKQCGRAVVPDVAEPCSLEAALERLGGRPAFVATPGASAGLADLVAELDRVALLVGPEGGFDEGEQRLVEAAGARSFSLGPTILRIETAAVVAVHLAAT